MNNPILAARGPRLRFVLLTGLALAALLPALAADAKADLVASQAAMEAQTNYRYSYQVTSTSGKVAKSVMEYVRPDRRRQTMANTELIIIGKDVWSSRSGGAWRKLPPQQAVIFAPSPGAAKAILDKQTITLVGSDTLNGRAMNVYRSQYADNGLTSDTKVWVGKSDRLIYKTVGTSDATAMKVEGVGKSASVGVYQYNVPGLSIEAPK